MKRVIRCGAACILAAIVSAVGCESPYHADRGALLGGLGGAGVGALVGHAMGNTGAGAAIGAGVGALSGAAIGAGMDEVEAKNRAMIEAQLGRRVRPGSVTIDDVVMMTQGHVNDDLVINHIRAHGMVAPPSASDLIALQQKGVSTRVIQVMQEPPPARRETVVVEQPPQTVIVRDYGPRPYWGPRYYYPPPRPGVRVGIAIRD